MASVGLTSKWNWTFNDVSGEKTRTQLHFEPLDDSGDNSGLLDPATGAVAVVGTLLDTLTQCLQAGTTMSVQIDPGTESIPTDFHANREEAARMYYSDVVTGEVFRFDIPGPNPAIRVVGSDDINMSDALMIAFKIAFDANCKSPRGNGVDLMRGTFVGRRS